jgi:hypothetical protein
MDASLQRAVITVNNFNLVDISLVKCFPKICILEGLLYLWGT